MKQFLKIAAVAIMFFALPVTSSAQKIGHIDVDSLLKIWPAYQKVVDSLTNYQLQAQKTIQQMQIEYANKQREIDSTKGTSTPLLQALRENQLKQIEDNLYAYVQLAEQEAGSIQAKMVDSLYKQLNTAIEAVAKEKGYKYILDSSKGGQVLYADPADDVFEAVRVKLKIPAPTKPAPKPSPAPGGAPAPGGK